MKYVLQRIGQAAFTVLSVVTITFGLIKMLPGGPISYLKARYAQQGMDPSLAASVAAESLNLNPDKPVVFQYTDYVIGVFQGDLGQSYSYREPVAGIIAEALPWTLFVMSFGLLLMFFFGILFGAILAYNEESTLDYTGSFFSTVMNSVPYYVAALLLVYLLGYRWGWFPTGGKLPRGVEPGLTLEFVQGAAYHAFLPIVSIFITGFGAQALLMRGNSISVLGEDYLRVARLRGLASNYIATRYVTRNAVLPMYTNFMISIGFMFGGSVILERIFTYNGVGYYMFESILSRDIPLMMGIFLVITLAVVVGIFVADLTYGFLDPRAGSGASRESYGTLSLGGSMRTVKAKLLGLLNRPRVETDAGIVPDGTAPIEAENSVFETTADVDVTFVDRANRARQRAMVPLRILWSDWRGKLGIFIILAYLLLGTVGTSFITPPSTNQAPVLLQPMENPDYPLGTDGLGQDLLALVIYAIPPMFEMILSGAIFATVIAMIVGTFSGYAGGATDRALVTVSDIMMTIPGLPLVIVIASVFRPEEPWVVGILLTINVWAGLARSIRSEVLSIRDEGYVEASRLMGASTGRTLRREVAPNLMPYVLINFAQSARSVIFASVGLYFLGVLPSSHYNWGVMMNSAYNDSALYLATTAHWIFFPMIAIVLLTLAMVMITQSADKVFNPRLRAKHAGDSGEIEDAEGETPVSTPAD